MKMLQISTRQMKNYDYHKATACTFLATTRLNPASSDFSSSCSSSILKPCSCSPLKCLFLIKIISKIQTSCIHNIYRERHRCLCRQMFTQYNLITCIYTCWHGSFSILISMYACIYVHVCVWMYVYMYILTVKCTLTEGFFLQLLCLSWHSWRLQPAVRQNETFIVRCIRTNTKEI